MMIHSIELFVPAEPQNSRVPLRNFLLALQQTTIQIERRLRDPPPIVTIDNTPSSSTSFPSTLVDSLHSRVNESTLHTSYSSSFLSIIGWNGLMFQVSKMNDSARRRAFLGAFVVVVLLLQGILSISRDLLPPIKTMMINLIQRRNRTARIEEFDVKSSTLQWLYFNTSVD